MATASQFDLNRALQLWLAQLGQSPQVKAENLTELESHVRDSVIQLQSKGLSSEESFLVATHRVGSPEKLEPEFAKVNRNPWNMIIHGFVLVFFSIGCWLLWGVMQIPRMMANVLSGRLIPAFTQLLMDCSPFLSVPPLLALIYCLYALSKKSSIKTSWMGFFATTAGAMLLLAFPIIVAVLLPFVQWINSQPR
jgi:uncharacterized membrane-anchored protein